MLRFDVPPVWSNVIRWEAFITFVLSAVALLSTPWVMLMPAVQGLVRGFVGHHRCPLHLLWRKIAETKQWGGRKENAGAKMFANKLLFVASAATVALHAAGSGLWIVPCAVLLVFSFFEWSLAFCAACWAYGLWYRFFPPATQ